MDLLEKWPDVNINRKNSEKQIFSDYFQTIDENDAKRQLSDIPEVVKDIEVSNEARQQGNKEYAKRKYSAAMISYQQSIAFAPRDSIEYGLSLANRSVLLFDLKRYKECLQDIEQIYRSEYPENMLYKIFMREAKCYLELHRYKEASKANENAKINFRSVKDTLEQNKIDDVVNKINYIDNCLRNCSNNDVTSVEDEDESSLPELTAGENPRFAYASNTVTLRKNRVRGKHVVASVDIQKGDVLFIEEPYSCAMFTLRSESLTYCSRCFITSLTCIPCTTCTSVFFCTDQCRQAAWDERHRWECAGIRRGVTTGEASLTLGILFRASRTGFNTTMQQRYVYGNKQDNYPYVNQMLTHKHSIDNKVYNTYVKTAAYLVVYLKHFTDYFDWLYAQHNRPRGSRDQLYKIIGGLLLKTMCQTDTNKEVVEDQFVELEDCYNIGLRSMKLSYAIYVSSNLLNHSCLPNAVKSFHGSTKIVRALADIKRGTEITVCYVRNANLAHYELRRIVLMKQFYFNCTCEYCVDQNILFPWLCEKCKGPAYTTSDQRIAHCQQCRNEFPLTTYKRLRDVSKESLELFDVTNNVNFLKKTEQIMARIYYQTNWKLSLVYGSFVLYYQRKGDFQHCLEYLEVLIDLNKAVYEGTAIEDYVSILLKYCLTCVNFYLWVKDQYPQMYNMAKDAIIDTMDLLEYYISQKLIDNYKDRMIRILDEGDPNFARNAIRCHYNIIE